MVAPSNLPRGHRKTYDENEKKYGIENWREVQLEQEAWTIPFFCDDYKEKNSESDADPDYQEIKSTFGDNLDEFPKDSDV